MRKEERDWEAPEVRPRQGGWRMWLAFAAAGILIFAFRGPLLHEWNNLTGRTDEEISVTVLPASGPEKGGSTINSVPFVSSRWVLIGKVYDLMTLKPVARANLIFEDVKLNKHFEISSKSDGGFRAELPAASAGGYYVKVRYPGYISRVLFEEGQLSMSLRSLSESKRMRLGKDFARTIVRAKLVAPLGNEQMNFFLVPSKFGN